MKKSLFALASLTFIAASAMAQASNPVASLDGAQVTAAAPEAKSPYTFELGLTNYFESYDEFYAGSKLMSEDAPMVGIRGSVARGISATGGKVVLSGEFAQGKANYTGSYMGGSYGDLSISNLRREMFDITGVYKHAPSWNQIVFSGGLGYRSLTDRLDDAGAGGYKRVNTRLYGIMGAEREFKTADWTITPSVQYKHSLVSSQFSDFFGGIDTDQKTGYGAELAVSFVQRDAAYPLVIKPFVRTWELADSEIVQGMLEPKNSTREVGITVSLQF